MVIDGDSRDGAVKLLEEFIPVFSHAQIPFGFVSESNHDIYDAMNRGTRMAEGNWLLFLNAGDLLADTHVLVQIHFFLSMRSPDIRAKIP